MLTIVGHLLGWKKIKLPSFLAYFSKANMRGGELLEDGCTHPQVIFFIIQDTFIILTLFLFPVYLLFSKTTINTWFIWLFDCAIYFIPLARFIFIIRMRNKAYAKYLVENSIDDNS